MISPFDSRRNMAPLAIITQKLSKAIVKARNSYGDQTGERSLVISCAFLIIVGNVVFLQIILAAHSSRKDTSKRHRKHLSPLSMLDLVRVPAQRTSLRSSGLVGQNWDLLMEFVEASFARVVGISGLTMARLWSVFVGVSFLCS